MESWLPPDVSCRRAMGCNRHGDLGALLLWRRQRSHGFLADRLAYPRDDLRLRFGGGGGIPADGDPELDRPIARRRTSACIAVRAVGARPRSRLRFRDHRPCVGRGGRRDLPCRTGERRGAGGDRRARLSQPESRHPCARACCGQCRLSRRGGVHRDGSDIRANRLGDPRLPHPVDRWARRSEFHTQLAGQAGNCRATRLVQPSRRHSHEPFGIGVGALGRSSRPSDYGCRADCGRRARISGVCRVGEGGPRDPIASS